MQASVKDIAAAMEALAPKDLAEDWDNVGLMLGRSSRPVSKVLVALDLSAAVIAQAKDMGAEMLVTHHPAIFKALKRIGEESWQQELLLQAAEAGIAVYSAHTNLDCAHGGVNDALAQLLGLQELEPLDPNSNLGRIGYLSAAECMTVPQLAAYVKERLGAAYVNYAVGSGKIERIAICGGAGADFINLALERGADTLITGDVKYHSAQDAIYQGLNIIDAGHQATELPVLPLVQQHLCTAAQNNGWQLQVAVAQEEQLLQSV